MNVQCNALKDFSNNKTPGTDGLPAEFYRFFWPDMCLGLQASCNYAFQHGTLSMSQKRGIINSYSMSPRWIRGGK